MRNTYMSKKELEVHGIPVIITDGEIKTAFAECPECGASIRLGGFNTQCAARDFVTNYENLAEEIIKLCRADMTDFNLP
jgi:hypothetical protein